MPLRLPRLSTPLVAAAWLCSGAAGLVPGEPPLLTPMPRSHVRREGRVSLVVLPLLSPLA